MKKSILKNQFGRQIINNRAMRLFNLSTVHLKSKFKTHTVYTSSLVVAPSRTPAFLRAKPSQLIHTIRGRII